MGKNKCKLVKYKCKTGVWKKGKFECKFKCKTGVWMMGKNKCKLVNVNVKRVCEWWVSTSVKL